MAGHSKWHNIQKKKGAADAKRGQLFTKLAQSITMAVREGGGEDADFNFQLRVAVDSAKSANMPKENIVRAIDRGMGRGGNGPIEEIIYEGFANDGIALLIRCMTDNRNRTVADVKHLLSRHGGRMADQGSVMWMFEKKGVVTLLNPDLPEEKDAFELSMIDAGAEDIRWEQDVLQVIADISDLKSVLEAVEEKNMKPDGAGIEYLPKETVSVSQEAEEQAQALIDVLDEYEDVDTVFSNL